MWKVVANIIRIFFQTRSFALKYERYLSGGALLAGFIVDSLTLSRIDLLFDNLILLFYLTVAGSSIFLLNFSKRRFIQRWVPYAMQYAFGGLFSGFVIFYMKSATLAAAWPFIIFLLILLIGNEFFKTNYQKFIFQHSIYFIALFSYFIFLIPVVIGHMGPWVFILSGFTSLLAISGFVYLTRKYSVFKSRTEFLALKISVGVIFIAFNFLYFTNIIPPIPLSIKELGIYYNVRKVANDQYVVQKEDIPWYRFYDRDEFQLERDTANTLYAYSAVFAPTRISSVIFHKWSFYDTEREEWIPAGSIHYPINGGRDGGYRGFTIKHALRPGKWRVDVTTDRNQILGRIKFEVKDRPKPELISEFR